MFFYYKLTTYIKTVRKVFTTTVYHIWGTWGKNLKSEVMLTERKQAAVSEEGGKTRNKTEGAIYHHCLPNFI